jgi:hypothetical protein
MEVQDFNGKMQDLILLGGESEITSQFSAELQAVLNETQEAVDMAMEPEEFEAVRLHLPQLRRMLEAQTEFLERLKEETLRQMFPGDALPGPETLN